MYTSLGRKLLPLLESQPYGPSWWKLPCYENNSLISELYLVSSILAVALASTLFQKIYVLISYLILAREAIAMLLG